ncbi:SAM-dependent methyltransferase [Glaciimonas sp. PCH181]|nr:SAM-dependent methyltransferase [Glaciimonas sp. PCH181]
MTSRIKPEAAGSFRIVGIGASAGGLEAFEQFFRPCPDDSGMAFILISHLDPDHASLLTEILQRSTAMRVSEAQDNEQVLPNCVYVIPPNRDLTILDGALHLSVPVVPRGQRMAIDMFMSSLAQDQGKAAVGIVLSGTGTDGTNGLNAILEAGGVSLVQDPTLAKYDGMPRSAINAGYASFTLPAEKMAARLLDHHFKSTVPIIKPAPAAITAVTASSISRILQLLQAGTGHDFSLYKVNTIFRRIQRRMTMHSIHDIEVYARYLGEHPPEVQILFKELLINVTRFFRDPDTFSILKKEILAPLLAEVPDRYILRAWIAGCATGEEAYSIAIILRELMNESGRECKVQLYSTDLDDEAIAVARAGLYAQAIADDVGPERLQRFFLKEDAGYRIKKEIREMVVFAVHNMLKDPPFTKLDLLSCRNVMIYLEPELQNRLIPSFHYALKPNGTLLLSPSEGVGTHTELFTPINRKWKLYRSVPSSTPTRLVQARDLSWTADIRRKTPEDIIKKTKETNFAELTKRVLLQTFAPASVITDAKGDILYVHGDTGKYLRPAPGQASLNVIEMARDGLQTELRVAIYAAANLGTSTLNQELTLKANDTSQLMTVSVRPLLETNTKQDLLLVSFKDVAPPRPMEPGADAHPASTEELRQIEELQRELTYTKESLHSTIEEQQNFNEELKCVNEEMQSTNEELQSTNEELETSKEELQSVNEELVTVNAELEAKIEQLADMQNDMKNLLENIHVGTIFLDQHMHVRRFTRDAVRIYRLAPSDMGRALGDIKSELRGEDLLGEAQVVLDTLIPLEREVSTLSGDWYLARIQPYRTLDNVIDGVVLTFTDITEHIKAMEAREAQQLAEGIINTVREPLLVLDNAFRIISASHSFYREFKVQPQDTVGCLIYEVGNRQWDIPALRQLLESVRQHNQTFEDYPVEQDFPIIGRRKMLLNARRIVSKTGESNLILLALAAAV